MTLYFQLFRTAIFASALSSLSAVASAETDFILKRDLDTRSDVTCSSETAFGNLVSDALKKSLGVDVALVNCAVIAGNKTYAAGSSFTPGEVATEISAGHMLSVIELSGAHLLESLEHAVAKLPASSAAFPQVAGLRMDVDLSKPAGTRVVKLTVNGAALDFTRSYKIATTQALADGAEGYVLFKAAMKIVGPNLSIAEILATYLQATGVKDVKVLGRIEILK